MTLLSTTQSKFIIILVLVGFLTYGVVLQNGFVWDDFDQVVNNKGVHSLSNIGYIFSGSTFNSGGADKLVGVYYKPLMPFFFAILYSLFGPNAMFFHGFQLLIHIANALLLFLFLRRYLKDWSAFIASLLFLVHPINTETVVYISALQDALYFFFGILGLFLMEIGWKKESEVKRLAYNALVMILFLCSMLSKETGVVFLVLGAVYTAFFYKKYLPVYGLYLFFAITAYIGLRFAHAGVYFKKEGGIAPIMRIDLLQRIYTMPAAFLYYLKTLIFPMDLAIAQHWIVTKPALTSFFLPLILVFGVFAMMISFCIKTIRENSQRGLVITFFFLWFLIGLFVHSQLIPLDMTVAERWFYVASAGIFAFFAYILEVYLADKKSLQPILIAIGAILLILLSVRSAVRTLDWRNINSLYSHDIGISDSFDLENNYGVALYRQGKYAEALPYFQKSVDNAPYWYTNWHNLALVYERMGDMDKAIEYYQTALQNSDGAYYTYESLIRLRLMQGNASEAKDLAFAALGRYNNNDKIGMLFALANYKLGNQNQAMFAARKAVQMAPTKFNKYVLSLIEKKKPIDVKKLYRFD